MEKTSVEPPFEGIFGSTPELKVLQFLLAHSHFDYTKKEIAEHAGVSRQTVYNVIDLFRTWGIMKETRKIGNVTLYTLDRTNHLVQAFKKFDNEIINIITSEELRKAEHTDKQRAPMSLLTRSKKRIAAPA